MEPQKTHIEVSWAHDTLQVLFNFCKEQLDQLRDDQLNLAVQLVVEELVTNVFKHGYGNLDGKVDVTIDVDHKTVKLTVQDRSLEFNPWLIVPDNADPGEGKRGLSLVRRLTETTLYERTPEGTNILTCIFPRSTDSPVG